MRSPGSATARLLALTFRSPCAHVDRPLPHGQAPGGASLQGFVPLATSGIHEKALHAVLIQASGCHANVPMSRRRNHSGLVWLRSYFAQDCTPRLFRKLAPSLGRSNWASAAVLEEGSLTPRLLSLDQGWIQRSRHDVQQGQQGQQYLTGERRCSAS